MSTCRYGDGTLYGAAGVTYGAAVVTDRPVTWMFEVDWDGDGVFNGENEGKYMYALQTETGRQWLLNGSGDGLEPVMTGTGSVEMMNESGRFNPFNLDGPLAGMLLPGRQFRLRVQRESDGLRQDVMAGRIQDIRPLYAEVDRVKISFVNAVEELKKRTVRTTVQSAIRYDAAIVMCLDDIGWTDGRDIDTTVSEVMEYWWGSGRNAMDEIQSIADAALGMFCIGEDGGAVYKSRVSNDVPLMTITGDDIQNSYGVKTPMPWESVRNRIRVYARKRTAQTGITLWETQDRVKISAGGEQEVWAEFALNGEEAVATSITNPVDGTDYEANSQEDGLGTDLSANIAITLSKFATTAKLTIRNNGGTDAYLVPPSGSFSLRLRGDAITADKYTFVERADNDSIEVFGDRPLTVKSDWLQDINTARDEADILRSRLAAQRQFPRFALKDEFDLQFGAKLFGLVLVDFERSGVTGEYRFGYIKHRWTNRLGWQTETEIYLEPNLLGNVSGTWVFPAVFGVTTVF